MSARRTPPARRALPGLLALLLACAPEPTPLPTEQAVAEVDRGAEPPLYQLLYDAPALPAPPVEVQRVRLLVWLRHLELRPDQLRLLEELRVLATERSARLEAAEAELAARYAAQEAAVHEQIWEALRAGVPVDAPEMADWTEQLRELRAGGARERELLALRMEGIRSILDAEQPLLRTLTPRQEALFADALFLLRHRLDPVGQPGDFRALVGTTYDPGQYAVLTRGTSETSLEPMNIGALWADEAALKGHALHEARREVLLFLALLEPGLDEAIAAARGLAAQAAPAQATPGEAPPAEPAPE